MGNSMVRYCVVYRTAGVSREASPRTERERVESDIRDDFNPPPSGLFLPRPRLNLVSPGLVQFVVLRCPSLLPYSSVSHLSNSDSRLYDLTFSTKVAKFRCPLWPKSSSVS